MLCYSEADGCFWVFSEVDEVSDLGVSVIAIVCGELPSNLESWILG